MADTQFSFQQNVPARPIAAAGKRLRPAEPDGWGETSFRPTLSSPLLIVFSSLLFAMATFIALFGSSWPVEMALVGFGVCAAGLSVKLADSDMKLRRHLASLDERHQAALEALSDRMWEMQEGEARSRDLIDALGDLVVHRDQDGRIVYANRIFTELVGSSLEEIQGRTLGDLKIDVGLAADTAFSDGECLTYNDVSIQSADSIRWFSWIELSTRDDATGAVSHRAIARDITVRKNAEASSIEARERAEYANRSKSRFLATVSHEIRTPLNGIMGMATLLADTTLSPEQRTYVKAVSTSSNALLVLIEDLLDFSTIEARKFELHPQPLVPRELVENIAELLVARAYSKGIGVGTHVAADVPDTIVADPGRLRQVLLNVIGNAVKFTDAGGVLVDVSVNRRKSPQHIRFVVEDTGPGLNPSDRARIFEEFEQGDGTSTRRHGGTGLGLAISKRIVNAMGGTIAVENGRDGGAVFVVEIPIAGSPVRSPRQNAELAGRRFLLVSSNTVETEALRRSIAGRRGSAVLCTSLDELHDRPGAWNAPFDAVVVDAQIEGGQSSALKAIRDSGADFDRAIIMIAPNERGRLPALQEDGYSGFLARPVRSKTLVRVLGEQSDDAPGDKHCEMATGRAEPARGAQSLSVLTAEDNEINSMLVTAALKKAGHKVTVVANGKAAVAAATARGAAFDVILMDLHMPVMDGLDAIALIRKHEESEGLDAIPILALTADGQASTREDVIARGATGYVTKPIDPLALVGAIDSAVAAAET